MAKRKTSNYLNRNFNKERSEDKLSKDERSKRMSLIRSKSTKFEEDFIKSLSKATRKKFKTHVRAIRGCPDIVFEKDKLCVFMDSNFWHGWQYPRWKHLLKNDFWRNKIENNRRRDKKTTQFLRKNGWTVIRIWEHGIKKGTKKNIELIMNNLIK